MVVRLNPALSSVTFKGTQGKPQVRSSMILEQGAKEVKPASSLGRYFRNSIIGLVSLGTVATTSCKKDPLLEPTQPKDTTTIVPKNPTIKPVDTTHTTPVTPVDTTHKVPVTPTETMSLLEKKFVEASQDVMALDSTDAGKLDSVLVKNEGTGQYLSWKADAEKSTKDTIFLNTAVYSKSGDSYVRQGSGTKKVFLKDTILSSIGHSNDLGTNTELSYLKDNVKKVTTEVINGVKSNEYSKFASGKTYKMSLQSTGGVKSVLTKIFSSVKK